MSLTTIAGQGYQLKLVNGRPKFKLDDDSSRTLEVSLDLSTNKLYWSKGLTQAHNPVKKDYGWGVREMLEGIARTEYPDADFSRIYEDNRQAINSIVSNLDWSLVGIIKLQFGDLSYLRFTESLPHDESSAGN